MIKLGIIRKKRFFKYMLLEWNQLANDRQMPWKNESDPYKIWISEIILQQTRVQQGLNYYNRFIKAYPTVHHIARAPESEVYKLWEGLGYYSRCKNIIATARYIAHELDGKFPERFEDILQLKGIGNYTASAIASFAYNLPYAVLDGNVFRVLSRFFGLETPIDTAAGKMIYSSIANELLDRKAPGIYNQAIMDFGATVCKPKPLCALCALQQKCFAFNYQMVNKLPMKEKVVRRRQRWFYYLVINFQNKYYVRKRVSRDIWQNLNEFVLIETDKHLPASVLQASAPFDNIFNSATFEITSVSQIYTQQLTHQTITGCFIHIEVTAELAINGYHLVSANELKVLPFPKFISAYLKD